MSDQVFKKVTADATSLWKGLRLQITKWEPESPKALLYVAHGVSEHMGRYDKLGEHLASCGILMFGHDHVGHGNSEGDRVHIEDYNQYVQDVVQTIESMKTLFPTLPLFLMGHSMGGLISGLVAIERQDLFTGLIFSSALAEVDPSNGWFIQTLAKVVAVVAPQLGLKKLDTSFISSIPEEVQAYVEDPLIYHGAVKARWGVATLNAIDHFRQEVQNIRLPLLIIHGTEDRIVQISASEFLASNVSSTEIRFEKFVGSRHEVLHDTEQDRARGIFAEWLLAKI